jgi:hypothetical protein
MRNDIADLDEQGLRDLVHQPPSREKIAELLPTIKRASPAIVKSTEPKYFQEQVDSCRYFLSDQEWTRHPTVLKSTSCEIAAKAVVYEFAIIMKSVRACKAYEPVPRHGCSNGEFFVDATIAVLDIGMLLIERHKRTARKDRKRHLWCTCECQVCGEDCDDVGHEACQVVKCLEVFGDTLFTISPIEKEDTILRLKDMEDDESVQKEWFAAICYATPDGSPHPLRSVLAKYIDLPSLVIHSGPNTCQDADLIDRIEGEIIRMLLTVQYRTILDRHTILDRKKSSPIPNIVGLSI